MKKAIAILGSTGSIGTQTLDVVDLHPESFEVKILSAHTNVDKLIEQCKKFKPSLAIIADESKYNILKKGLANSEIEIASGSDSLIEAMGRNDFDTLVSATVGYSGLEPTISAMQNGKRIALANKETLVVAGELIKKIIKDSKSEIIPVDSEHSAIYQCIQGEKKEEISRLLLTASGGPFLKYSKSDLENVTVAEALCHPKWKMGKKITIDSATMMNKAFEIIEAYWLFGVEASNIEAVIHPQSIIHSLVEFRDGSLKAQLGTPDMRIPISYALYDGKRCPCGGRRLTIAEMSSLTFENPDFEKFPCLGLGYYAIDEGGTTACTINAANEAAVEAFLEGAIRFNEIYKVIECTLAKTKKIASPSLEDYIAVNKEAGMKAKEIIDKIKKGN